MNNKQFRKLLSPWTKEEISRVNQLCNKAGIDHKKFVGYLYRDHQADRQHLVDEFYDFLLADAAAELEDLYGCGFMITDTPIQVNHEKYGPVYRDFYEVLSMIKDKEEACNLSGQYSVSLSFFLALIGYFTCFYPSYLLGSINANRFCQN